MKQKIYAVVFAAGLIGKLSAAEGSTDIVSPTSAVTLDSVLAEVLAKNPSLKAARANWQAMEARVSQERAWVDPRVGVDVERSGTTRFFTFTDNEWMVSQELPLSGKNRRRARAASAEAAAAFAQVDRRRLELTRDARVAFYNLLNAQKQIELNDKNAELLKQFSEITRVKYEAGTRMQSDVLMAQPELLRNQEARRDLDRQSAETRYRLNVLMNRKPDAPWGRAEMVEVPPFNSDAQMIEGHALVHRPELRVTIQKIA